MPDRGIIGIIALLIPVLVTASVLAVYIIREESCREGMRKHWMAISLVFGLQVVALWGLEAYLVHYEHMVFKR
jgi:hypothetical protein